MVRVCGFGPVSNPSHILVYWYGLVSGWPHSFHGSVLCSSDSTSTTEKEVLFYSSLASMDIRCDTWLLVSDDGFSWRRHGRTSIVWLCCCAQAGGDEQEVRSFWRCPLQACTIGWPHQHHDGTAAAAAHPPTRCGSRG
jgi:hypothetical protein